jgi:protease I
MDKLDGKTIVFLATDGVEQIELTESWKAVGEEGATPRLISIEGGEIQGFDHIDKADTFEMDLEASDAKADNFDGLVLPGGVATPTSCGWTRTPCASCTSSWSRASRSAPSSTPPGPS